MFPLRVEYSVSYISMVFLKHRRYYLKASSSPNTVLPVRARRSAKCISTVFERFGGIECFQHHTVLLHTRLLIF
jgi:hypothetical protein